MKLLAIAILCWISCSGFTCALSRQGDFLATSGSLGVVHNRTGEHLGGIVGFGGEANTKRTDGNVEATRPGYVRVGKESDGIVLRGTIHNRDPLETAGDLLRDLLKIKTAGELGKEGIQAAQNIGLEALKR